MSGLLPALTRTQLCRASVRSFSSSAARATPPPPAGDGGSSRNEGNRNSSAALEYKLSHRLRELPPLPSLEPAAMDASEAVSNILYNTPAPSKQPFKR